MIMRVGESSSHAHSLISLIAIFYVFPLLCACITQPPPSPENEWESDEEDGVADQDPLGITL